LEVLRKSNHLNSAEQNAVSIPLAIFQTTMSNFPVSLPTDLLLVDDPVKLPGETAMELLIHLTHQSRVGGGGSVALTPGELQSMMRSVTGGFTGLENPVKDKDVGLPRVIFACTSHTNRLVLGATAPALNAFRKAGLDFVGRRWNRFGSTTDPFNSQQEGIAKRWRDPPECFKAHEGEFTSKKNMHRNRTDPDIPVGKDWKTLTHAEKKASLIRYLSSDRYILEPPPTKPFVPFNHDSEVSRSFWVCGDWKERKDGTGTTIPGAWFKDISRCFKCRILHEYAISGIENQDDVDTINSTGTCAEDLCHSFCLRVQP